LRGGKYSWFEGGVRAAAFVSGGYIPETVRGTKQTGMMAIADWYTTFSVMAGVNPEDPIAKAAGLPPVDGLDLWPLLSGQNATSPRVELAFGTDAYINGQYKLLLGSQSIAGWQGVHYPNASSNASAPSDVTLQCGSGCLFDVVADPNEYNDIAAQNPTIVSSMHARLNELIPGFFSNNDTGVNVCPGNITMPCACWAAWHVWGGYFGPFQY
jgi:arylsulfatase A-like enzyme